MTMPAAEPLTEEQTRELLRTCAVVMKPGETLILRTTDLTPEQMDCYQQAIDAQDFPFRAVVVHAAEVAVAEAAP